MPIILSVKRNVDFEVQDLKYSILSQRKYQKYDGVSVFMNEDIEMS